MKRTLPGGLMLLAMLLPVSADAQQPFPQPKYMQQHTQYLRSDDAVYSRFFLFTARLRKEFLEASRKGINVAPEQRRFLASFGFTEAEAGPLFAIADRLIVELDKYEANLGEVRTRARISAERRQEEGRPRSSDEDYTQQIDDALLKADKESRSATAESASTGEAHRSAGDARGFSKEEYAHARQWSTALVLEAREQLRTAFGPERFTQLDKVIRSRFGGDGPERTAPPETGMIAGVIVSSEARTPGAPPFSVRTYTFENAPPEVRERMLRTKYVSFFRQYTDFKRRAEEDQRNGLTKSADAMRTMTQRGANLSDEETEVLDRVVTEHSRAYSELERQQRELVQALRELRMRKQGNGEALAANDPEMLELRQKGEEISRQMEASIDATLQTLRSQMGEEGFKLLQNYVIHPSGTVPATATRSRTLNPGGTSALSSGDSSPRR